MSITEQITYVRDELQDWAAAYGGGCEIAGDIVHAFALLQHKPGSVRCVVWLSGEEKRGEYEEAGFVDRTFTVFVSRGRGFTLEPGDSLTARTAGNAEPLYDLVEEARQVIRGLEFAADETEVTPNFKSIRPFAFPTERPVDAYQIEFSIGSELADQIMSTRGLYARTTGSITVPEDDGIDFIPSSETYDDFSVFAAGVFTAPKSGLYLVEVGLHYENQSGGYVQIQTQKNGQAFGETLFGNIVASVPNYLHIHQSTVVKVARGEALSFRIHRGDGYGGVTFQPNAFLKIHPL